MSETPLPTAATPGSKKNIKAPKKRRKGGLFNLILIIGIIITISLFVWAEQQRREAQQKLRQTATELEELRKSAETSGQEVADRILEKVKKHMQVQMDPQPTVATIVDAQALKDANEFYQPAENGDHLVITEKRAILYDEDRDLILDVVPVTLDQQKAQQEQQGDGEQSPTPEGQTPSPSPSTNVSPSPSPQQ